MPFSYKKTKVKDTLDEAAPDGIDCFFDNVGGNDETVEISRMREKGCIAICGFISQCNAKEAEAWTFPALQPFMIFKRLRMEGYYVFAYMDRWMEGINQLVTWVKEGKMVTRETVVDGFGKAPERSLHSHAHWRKH
jgi:NADPH-dependent curcumin reductase CurA